MTFTIMETLVSLGLALALSAALAVGAHDMLGALTTATHRWAGVITNAGGG